MLLVLYRYIWLFLHSYVNFRVGRANRDRLSGGFAFSAPGFQRVGPRWDALDRESAVTAGQREVRRGNDYDVSEHVRMKIAEQLRCTQRVKLERLFLAGRNNREAVAQCLVPSDGGPVDVVNHLVAVQKVNGGAALHDDGLRNELHVSLIHDGMRRRRIEFLAGNGV